MAPVFVCPVQSNMLWLKQAAALVNSLDEAVYAHVGPQMRHVIEFYECFLDGAQNGCVDYDARRRDPLIEASAAAAGARIGSLLERLQAALYLERSAGILVHLDGSEAVSTLSRELLALGSHTVHHFAIIALTLRANGIPVHPDFGVAPSTLHYRARQQAA